MAKSGGHSSGYGSGHGRISPLRALLKYFFQKSEFLEGFCGFYSSPEDEVSFSTSRKA